MYRLEEILKSKKISKTEFAKMLGITKQSIPNILNGNPTKSRLEEVAHILGIPVWQLFAAPEEVRNGEKEKTFVAMFKDGEEQYFATSVEEAEQILLRIKERRKE